MDKKLMKAFGKHAFMTDYGSIISNCKIRNFVHHAKNVEKGAEVPPDNKIDSMITLMPDNEPDVIGLVLKENYKDNKNFIYNVYFNHIENLGLSEALKQAKATQDDREPEEYSFKESFVEDRDAVMHNYEMDIPLEDFLASWSRLTVSKYDYGGPPRFHQKLLMYLEYPYNWALFPIKFTMTIVILFYAMALVSLLVSFTLLSYPLRKAGQDG